MPPPAKKTAPPTLAQTLTGLRKGGARLGSLSSFDMRPEGLSTGNLTLDALTGCGGIPKGRVSEFFGPPSSGKTTAALQAAGLLIQQGKRAMFLDYERSLDEVYCRALGIDPEAVGEDGEPLFMYEQPLSFEEGANIFRPLMQWVDLLIIDSVAAMVTQHELEAETGKVEVGARAKMMHQFMRQITGAIARHGTAVVLLNHVQDVIDTSPMGQRMKAQGITRQTTPGGSAAKFYSSLRVQFKQIGNVRGTVHDPITNTDVAVPIQTKTQVTVVKNKVGDPFGTAEVRVRFGKGFSNEWSALDVLVQHNRIKKDTGGVFRLVGYADDLVPEDADGVKNGVPWVRGEDNLIGFIEEHSELRLHMIEDAKKIIAEGGWTVTATDEQKAELLGEETAEVAAEKAAVDPETAKELDAMFDKNAPVG